MIASTVLAVFFVPVFFVLIQRIIERKKPADPAPATLAPLDVPPEKPATAVVPEV